MGIHAGNNAGNLFRFLSESVKDSIGWKLKRTLKTPNISSGNETGIMLTEQLNP
jgi:hypothetical protein